MKLILGLVWTLIRHYQIRSKGKGLSTKKAMIFRINGLIGNQCIENFTTDWNDGKALCALVESIKPGLCPNHEELDTSNGLENCRLGMNLAEEHLGIPQIMEPEDLNSSDVDDLSVMTYLSYFMSSSNDQLLQWLQRQLPERNIQNTSSDWSNGVNLAALVDRLFNLFPHWESLDPESGVDNMELLLPMIETSTEVKCPISAKLMADPQIDEITMAAYLGQFRTAKMHFSTGNFSLQELPKEMSIFKPVEVSVDVLGPMTDNLSSSIAVVGKMEDGTEYSATVEEVANQIITYVITPKSLGKMKVSIKYDGENIKGSPRNISVLHLFHLDGLVELLNSTPRVGIPISFKIIARESPPTDATINIIANGPSQSLQPSISVIDENIFLCTLTPDEAGTYDISIEFTGIPVEGSPFSFVAENLFALDTDSIADSCFVGIPACFNIHSLATVPDDEILKITGLDANGKSVIGSVTLSEEEEGLYECSVMPSSGGDFLVNVTFKDVHIAGSPFIFPVSDLFHVELNLEEKCIVGNPLKFRVVAQGDIPGGESVAVVAKGRNQEIIGTVEKSEEDSLFICSVSPNETGECEISATFRGCHIKGSPFKTNVEDMFELKGCPKRGSSFPLGSEVSFVAKVRGQINQQPLLIVTDDSGCQHVGSVTVDGEGNCTFTFTPPQTGHWTMDARYGGSSIKGTPFDVNIEHVFEIISTPVLDDSFSVGAPIGFRLRPLHTVSGSKDLEIIGRGPKQEIEGSVTVPEEEVDGTFAQDYECSVAPREMGSFEISALYKGVHVKNSPFSVCINDLFAVGEIPENFTGKVKEPVSFSVTALADPGSTMFTAVAHGATSQSCIGEVIPQDDNMFKVMLTPTEQGRYTVDVKLGESHIKGSPFCIDVVDPGKCKIIGKLPSSLHLNEAVSFKVSTAGSGQGALSAKCDLDGDSMVSVILKETGIDTYSVTLTPLGIGTAIVHLLFAGDPIPGTPFTVSIVDSQKCSITNLGEGLKIGDQISFVLSTFGAGTSKPEIAFIGHRATYFPKRITDQENGTFLVEMEEITEPSYYRVEIKYGGRFIPGCPFNFVVEPPPKVDQCHVTGPGIKRLTAGVPSTFKIMTTEKDLYAKKKLKVDVVAATGKRRGKVEITDNKDNSYTVKYVVSTTGAYLIHVHFYDQPVKGSPFGVTAREGPDASACKAYGQALDPRAVLLQSTPYEFQVNATTAGNGELVVVVRGSKEDPKVYITDDGEGVYSVKFEILGWGRYFVNVWWSGKHIPGSPFPLKVMPKPNPAMVKAFGPGIDDDVRVNEAAEFTIETKNAGIGTLSIRVYGVKDAFKVSCRPESNLHPRCLKAQYDPTWPGDYEIGIKWQNTHIPGSPFKVHVYDPNEIETYSSSNIVESEGEDREIEADDYESSGWLLTDEQTKKFANQLAKRHEIAHPLTSSTPMQNGLVKQPKKKTPIKVSFTTEKTAPHMSMKDPYMKDQRTFSVTKQPVKKGWFWRKKT